MKNLTAAIIKTHLTDIRERAESRHQKWMNDFQKNPCYALEWSDQVYIDAATIELAARQLDLIAYGENKDFDDEMIVAEIRKTVERELMRIATMNTNKSTGQGTNLMNAARVETTAKLHEWLNGRY